MRSLLNKTWKYAVAAIVPEVGEREWIPRSVNPECRLMEPCTRLIISRRRKPAEKEDAVRFSVPDEEQERVVTVHKFAASIWRDHEAHASARSGLDTFLGHHQEGSVQKVLGLQPWACRHSWVVRMLAEGSEHAHTFQHGLQFITLLHLHVGQAQVHFPLLQVSRASQFYQLLRRQFIDYLEYEG